MGSTAARDLPAVGCFLNEATACEASKEVSRDVYLVSDVRLGKTTRPNVSNVDCSLGT